MGSSADLDAVKKRNICCSLQESNFDSLIIQPVAWSLNSMSYTYCQYQNLLCFHTSKLWSNDVNSQWLNNPDTIPSTGRKFLYVPDWF